MFLILALDPDKENSSILNFSKLFGNYGNFQYNFGGGGKIKIQEEWWLRIFSAGLYSAIHEKSGSFPEAGVHPILQ